MGRGAPREETGRHRGLEAGGSALDRGSCSRLGHRAEGGGPRLCWAYLQIDSRVRGGLWVGLRLPPWLLSHLTTSEIQLPLLPR